MAGSIAGWVYASKTGGGFWRYVGWGLVGGFALSIPAYIATMPAEKKALLNKEEYPKANPPATVRGTLPYEKTIK